MEHIGQRTVVKKKNIFETSSLIKMSVLSGLAFVLMMLQFQIPIFPEFLKLDVSDIPVVIGTLAMGPAAGVIIEFIKNLLHFITGTKTAGIGEIANFLVGCAYVIPLGLIYKRVKGTKGVIIGMIAAGLSMVFFASLFNYFILIPVYAVFYGAPVEAFVEMAAKVNGLVVDFKTFILFAIAPFNIMKALIISVLGYMLYKILLPVLR